MSLLHGISQLANPIIRSFMTSSIGNIFRLTGRTKASDAALWCFLWSPPEPTIQQTMDTPVIWEAIYDIIVMSKKSYYKMCPWLQSWIWSISIWRRPLYRADMKTKSKWHLHLGNADIDVRYLPDIELPTYISSRIISYRYRSDIGCYIGHITLRHWIVNDEVKSLSDIVSSTSSLGTPPGGWHRDNIRCHKSEHSCNQVELMCCYYSSTVI